MPHSSPNSQGDKAALLAMLDAFIDRAKELGYSFDATLRKNGEYHSFHVEAPADLGALTAGPRSSRPPAEPTGGCGADVLRVLREAGRRLTLPSILDELAGHGCEWHERSVRRVLKEMQAAGLIDHNSSVTPPGYGAAG